MSACITWVVTIIVLSMHIHSIKAVHFHYPKQISQDEFPKWGGYCDTPGRQSPIRLSFRDSIIYNNFAELHFENRTRQQEKILMTNTGHTLRLSNFSSPMSVKGGSLLGTYIIDHINFHWWAEHTINNIRYPLECQIVHRNQRFNDLVTARKYIDGIAVISALYRVLNVPNKGIQKLNERIDDVKRYDRIGKPVSLQNFSVSDLIPHIGIYYTYHGSLTVPPCTESVNWIVMAKPYPITLEQFEKLKQIEYAPGEQLRYNFRRTQKTNNRSVIVFISNKNLLGNHAEMYSISYEVIALSMIFKIIWK